MLAWYRKSMKALVTRLKNLVHRPLWGESARDKARRRTQLFISMPFVLMAGLTWGILSAPTIGNGSTLLWSIVGATGFGAFFYLEQRLLPVVATLANRVGLGAVAALLWEVGVVGGLIFLFTNVLGAPTAPAVAIAIGIGALYSLGWEYILFGSAASNVASLLGGGFSRATGSDYSYAQALEMRGDLEGAIEIYKEAIRVTRRDPMPYLRLAAIRTREGLHEEAIDILRAGLSVARFNPRGRALAVREIHEISMIRLGNTARAAPDLVRYLEHEPEGQNGEWARRELADIKERIRQEG